jgi:hypothetical protein
MELLKNLLHLAVLLRLLIFLIFLILFVVCSSLQILCHVGLVLILLQFIEYDSLINLLV